MTTNEERDFNLEVGRRLKAARLDAGLSQEKLAKIIGVTYQQIQKYERGRHQIPACRYPKIIAATNFNVNDLLLGLPKPDVFATSNIERELVGIYRSLSQPKRRLILALARETRHQTEGR